MDIILEYPQEFRSELHLIARTLKRVSNKVQTQAICRHPQDYTHLPDALSELSEELETLLRKMQTYNKEHHID